MKGESEMITERQKKLLEFLKKNDDEFL